MRDQVFKIIQQALMDLDAELDNERSQPIGDATPIFGTEEGLDSLSLVRLIVDLEGQISEHLGQEVALADAKAFSTRNSPFQNVSSLADFILSKMDDGDAASHAHNGHA